MESHPVVCHMLVSHRARLIIRGSYKGAHVKEEVGSEEGGSEEVNEEVRELRIRFPMNVEEKCMWEES